MAFMRIVQKDLRNLKNIWHGQNFVSGHSDITLAACGQILRSPVLTEVQRIYKRKKIIVSASWMLFLLYYLNNKEIEGF